MVLVTGVLLFLVSLMAFFSGFGLGTVLTPILVLFMPLTSAIALTAVVHFLTSLMKCVVLRNHIDWRVWWAFGIPALCAAVVGALMLTALSAFSHSITYHIFSREAHIEILKVVIGVLLLCMVFVQRGGVRHFFISREWLPIGGLLSGFLGGLSGYQGAVRSIFLSGVVVNTQQFIATGAAIALCVDAARLVVYSFSPTPLLQQVGLSLILYVIVSALAGVAVGARFAYLVKLEIVRNLVSVVLCVLAVALIVGVV